LAIVDGQATVGVAATFITSIPPGPGSVVIVNTDASQSITISHNPNVTLTKGMILPPHAVVNVTYYPGNLGHQLYGIVSASTSVASFVVSSPGP
jgi:hypothetical protein